MTVSRSDLTPDQINAVEQAKSWFDSRTSATTPFAILGAAGTGKTTVARYVLEALGTTTQALAPTNRAAKVLRGKGVDARTIHSVLFQPLQWCWTKNQQVDSGCVQEESKHNHGPRFFKRADPPEGVRCFTIDEASMVGKAIADDVALFRIPTIVIGDPYQLPPVMDKPGYGPGLPGVELQISHRFDTLSDIGRLANEIRVSRNWRDWKGKIKHVGFDEVDSYDLLLAWRNETRWKIITMLRSIRGRSLELPQEGDRLISVANTYEVGVLNADELTVCGPITDATHAGAVNIPTVEKGVVMAWRAGFRDFDGEQWAAKLARRPNSEICALTWAEVLTVHKAQGGEWPRVLVIDDLNKMNWAAEQRGDPREVNTWAYTAVTRASEQVDFIKVGDFPTGMQLRRLIAAGARS